MKTLILNGSPRKSGDTVALIDAMRRHLIGDVQVLSYSDNISPCIDCRFCWRKPGCSIDDKMQGIRVMDHVIFNRKGYYSFLEHGEI